MDKIKLYSYGNFVKLYYTLWSTLETALLFQLVPRISTWYFFLQYPRKFHASMPSTLLSSVWILYIYMYIFMLYCVILFILFTIISCHICYLIILKRGQFWSGGEPSLDETRCEEVVIKKVFHLTHKENVKKTKEVLENHGTWDSQIRYCETVCIKILQWVCRDSAKMIKNWEKKLLMIFGNLLELLCFRV